jgi:hypothetical protein
MTRWRVLALAVMSCAAGALAVAACSQSDGANSAADSGAVADGSIGTNDAIADDAGVADSTAPDVTPPDAGANDAAPADAAAIDAGPATCVPFAPLSVVRGFDLDSGCQTFGIVAASSCTVGCDAINHAPTDGTATCTVDCTAQACCTPPYVLGGRDSNGIVMCVTLGTDDGDGGFLCSGCGGYDCPSDYPYCSANCNCNAPSGLNVSIGGQPPAPNEVCIKSGGTGGCSRCSY